MDEGEQIFLNGGGDQDYGPANLRSFLGHRRGPACVCLFPSTPVHSDPEYTVCCPSGVLDKWRIAAGSCRLL